MKSAMTVWEAMERKKALERAVTELVVAFAKDTGLDVSVNMDAEHVEGKVTPLPNCHVVVSLPG